MTFTFDAVADPTNTPPRVILTATEDDPDLSLQSCDFFRDGVPLRFEAAVTGDEALAYDYDAPFDVPLVYRADGGEVGILDDWTETWASLASWLSGAYPPGSAAANWSVSAGVASASLPDAHIYRSTAGPIVRVDVTAPSNLALYLSDDSQVLGSVQMSDGLVLLTGSSGAAVSVAGSGDFTLTVAANSLTVAGTGWEATAPFAGIPVWVELGTPDGSPGLASVGAIAVRISLAIPLAVSDSDTETLSPTGGNAGAWLVNTAIPELAIIAEAEPASSDDPYFILTPATRQTRSMAANTATLAIEGSADVLTVTLGPRRYAQWTLAVGCTTEAAAEALEALLANSATISLRFPTTDRWTGLRGGFYAVGDVEGERLGHPQMGPIIVYNLPLTPSRAPKFKPLWQWSWDTLAQYGMSWDDVNTTFASWNDLLVGPG
jgi:hypothetical protein